MTVNEWDKGILDDALDYLIDSRVGVIQKIYELPREPGWPEFFHCDALASNTAAFIAQPNFFHAGGASADRRKAIARAVGEAVERYCSAIFDINEFPLTSFDEADFPCIEPELFALYGKEQYEQQKFPFVPFHRSTRIRWAEAFEPLTGQDVHVPACMVYVPYYLSRNGNEAKLYQPISTGLCCHDGSARAAYGGICEVIERDAFTITWQGKISPPQVIVETLSDCNYNLVRRLESSGVRVTVFDITMDHGVPTFLSVFSSRNKKVPAFVTAASANLNPEHALRASLEELVHTKRYCQTIKDAVPPLVPGPGFGNIRTQRGHLHFWNDQTNLELVDWLFHSEKRVDFDEFDDLCTGTPGEDVAVLCRTLEQTGHRVLLRDLTTPDIGDLGLSVVRAIVPGFHPLQMGYRFRALGGKRLWELPQKLGYPGITKETGDTPLPHPYP